MTRISRRRFVQAVVGARASVGLVRGQATTFELGGRLSGWVGRSPESIADETNPTLRLQVGKTYVIAWENLDGQPHNIAIGDGNGTVLKRTERVTEMGKTQTLEFTAKPKMATYFSEFNPETMRGKVVTRRPTTTANGTANATATASVTTVPTATSATTGSSTESAGTTSAETTTATDSTATDNGLPGFGFVAALGSLAGIGYLFRRSD
ncbi:cupredoxin domain-containing protein [Haladaptatus halobius]|uniref:cupredoxin domain-containing protein n=1 Tax=Haladaptatus halobius TaxID=2884875 RepID=UPI001D0B14C7|nr:PGF-CTERM sorting domain-containing protein [Haladaptatus halobius]